MAKIRHIAIGAEDTEKLATFYTATFGMREVSRMNNGNGLAVFLSDGYLGMGSEPWLVPDINTLPKIEPNFAETSDNFKPYERDPETLARPWAIPGTPGLEHRIGGLEKSDITGNVSYDPANHDRMVHLRAEKIARIARDVPDLEVHGDERGGRFGRLAQLASGRCPALS